MKARVDTGLSQAYGLFDDVSPDAFTLDEWGYAFTDDEPVPNAMEGRSRGAAAICPDRAITVEE